MNPNLVPVAKRKPKAPEGQQPDWLFPGSSSKSTTTKPQNSSSRIQIEKKESAKGPKAPASKPTGKPIPPPQLLTLIGAFLADYGFTTTQRTLTTERQSRSKIEGWNDQHGEKTSVTLKDIFEKYQKDTETKKTSLNDITKEDTKSSTKKDKLAKKENKIKKKPVPVQDSSSSSEVSDVEMNDAPAATKAASKKAPSSSSSSSGSSSSESSDSDADDEKEVAVVKAASPKAKANTLKRKAASSSSSSSSSNSSSDSSSEDEAPKSKKVKTVPAAAKSSSSDSESSSSSDSDSSSSDSNNDAKKAAAKAAQSSSSDDSSSDSSTQSLAKKTPLPDSSDSSSSDSDSDSSDDEKKADTTAKSESTATLASSESDSSSSDSEAETKATNAKKQERKLSPPLPPTPVPRLPKRNNVPFSRIPKDIVVDERLASNAFVPYDYAQRAHEDLIVTRGKGFTKEKNKKKRGSYRGGYIDVEGKKGIKFAD